MLADLLEWLPIQSSWFTASRLRADIFSDMLRYTVWIVCERDGDKIAVYYQNEDGTALVGVLADLLSRMSLHTV